MNKRKVIYVTIEDISSGLFLSQVLEPLKRIAKIDTQREFNLFVLNRPWKYLKHRKILKIIRNSFSLQKNISIKYIPLLPPLRNVTRSKLLSKFVTYFIGFLFFLFIDKKNSLYHSRSYWPCAAGLLINLNPMVFEPRSLWNLENIAMGTILKGSSSELYWNNLEKICVDQSEKVISINTQMANYFTTNYNLYTKNEIIPISFSNKNFTFNSTVREEIRKRLSLNNKKVFVYSGSLGMEKIAIKAILQTIKKLKESTKNAHFLFLAPNYETSSILDIMRQADINESDFTLIHPDFNEISNYLSAADYGYHSLPIQPDSFTRMGTKIVEYLSVGLPVIVNEHVGAAANILVNHKLGFTIYNDSNTETISNNLSLVLNIDRQERINFAEKEYEVSSVAKKYIKVYNEIDSMHIKNI